VLCLLQPSLESLLSEGSSVSPSGRSRINSRVWRFCIPPCGDSGDEMGLANHASHHRHPLAVAPRRSAQGLLFVRSRWSRIAAGIPTDGPAEISGDVDQATRPAALGMALARLPLRIAPIENCSAATGSCSRKRGRSSFPAAFRSRRARRIAADQEPIGHDDQVALRVSRRRSWQLTGTPVENSTEDLVGIFEFLAPGFLSADMKPRKMRPHRVRLRFAAHEGRGAHRTAAENGPRRTARTFARAARRS